jgi:hypothetical protein
MLYNMEKEGRVNGINFFKSDLRAHKKNGINTISIKNKIINPI